MVAQVTPASVTTSEGQLARVPSQRSATSHTEAALRQMWLGPKSVQWPSALAPCAAEQVSHAPVQPLLQQRPPAQKPEVHSVADPQLVPSVFFAEQYVPLHQVPEGHPAVQRIGQSVRVPLQTTAPPHAGVPGSLAGLGLQVPVFEGTSHRSQLRLQELSQQTRSAQKPLWHCRFVSHAVPMGFVCWQVPLMQKRPAAHCCEVVQKAGQPPWRPSHA